ncbi:hypothetical protein SCLCIDRAFT_997947 [Scleroderma citrinum Foug A]|uniref:Uncharacterized protein n=1 Tax=Scleroderma citrinum Foug A TaxID=1036808 RepID=A0A0C3EJB2_9AGAM|nr:hypothetical protein SCLCIDRAFT_997947 [Scleroderma citrinum Foug A]
MSAGLSPIWCPEKATRFDTAKHVFSNATGVSPLLMSSGEHAPGVRQGLLWLPRSAKTLFCLLLLLSVPLGFVVDSGRFLAQLAERGCSVGIGHVLLEHVMRDRRACGLSTHRHGLGIVLGGAS